MSLILSKAVIAAADLPPVGWLRECFRYEPDGGKLFWLLRPLSHFGSRRAWANTACRVNGQEAGSACHGYLRVGITFGGKPRLLYVHRIAFALMTGEWPAEPLDHANGNGLDNRWCNLRLASVQDNNRNVGVRSHNAAGFKWAHRTRTGRFVSVVTVDKKQVRFGTFDSPEEASARAASFLRPVHQVFLNTGESAR